MKLVISAQCELTKLFQGRLYKIIYRHQEYQGSCMFSISQGNCRMNNEIEIKTSGEYATKTQNRRDLFSKLKSQYNPNNLLNELIKHLALKNDAALAKTLNISYLIIDKIRQLTQPVSGTLLILMQEKSGFSLSKLRMLMGDRRQKSRISGVRLNSAMQGI
jgi:hypothetical protein